MRAQSLQAADAGANAAISRLEMNPACDSAVSSPLSLTDGARTLSKYQVRVDPAAGTVCEATLERVIRSWGFAPAESERSLRHVTVGVQLLPQDGFRFALFASGPTGVVQVKNTGSIDGDIYAENLDQSQNNLDAHDVITPGSIDTKNNSVYTGILWAGGNIKVGQDGSVAGSILSSGSSAPGNVNLENGVVVGKDVRAKGNVTTDTTTVVNGSIAANNPSVPDPPNIELPGFTWDPANYSPAPQTFLTGADATTYLKSASSDLQGTFYVPDSAGTVEIGRSTITGPLTIVTTGKVSLGQTLNASGGPWQVVIVSLSTASDAIRVAKPMTASPNLDMLLYTPGGVDIKNSTTMSGAIYADQIHLKNKLSLKHAPSLATNPPVGFAFGQSSAARFTVVPVLWREVVPGPPPA